MRDTSTPSVEGFEFRGNAREWFGIWIVNLLLTIITFGIYSAWAKVRANKYFYQHTFVAGRNFDYHATGLQILIGRIIVVAALFAYAIISGIMPLLGIVMVLGFAVLFPVLIVRSLRFQARMTSWSNVRFGFHGGAGQAFLVYLVYPVLTALTLYTTLPFLTRAMRRFTMGNGSLGHSKFSFDAPIGPFYKALFVAVAWVVGVSLICLAVFGVNLASFDPAAFEENPAGQAGLIAAIYAIVFLAFFPAVAIYQAFIRNVTYNNLTLEGGHRFASSVQPLSLVWIAITNAVLVLVSLGLLLPYAQVRITRYLADRTALIPGGPLDHFVARNQPEAGAIGDAYTDLEAVDVGLPI